MTSCVTAKDIDSFNNLSLKKSDPIPSNDSCLFTNLHPNIELKILKQLHFRDYRNLAFTCKKWYQTATSAPLSMKPDIRIADLIMDNGCFELHGKPRRIDPDVTSLNLINKVKCEYVNIRVGVSSDPTKFVSSDLKRFILLNRSHFEFDYIRVVRDMTERLNEEKYLLMEPLFDIASGIEWWCDWTNDEFLLQLLEKHVSHKWIKILFSRNPGCVNLVLKQWVNGKRPNLEFLSYTTRYTYQWPEFTKGADNFVKDRHVGLSGLFARVVVPGLPDLIVSGDFRDNGDCETQGIRLNRVDVSTPFFF